MSEQRRPSEDWRLLEILVDMIRFVLAWEAEHTGLPPGADSGFQKELTGDAKGIDCSRTGYQPPSKLMKGDKDDGDKYNI